MASFPRWNEDRLDELNRRVGTVERVVTDVAVMKTELRILSSELGRNTDATEHVARQLEDAKLEPLARSRTIRQGVIIGICSALAGGLFALLAALVAHS